MDHQANKTNKILQRLLKSKHASKMHKRESMQRKREREDNVQKADPGATVAAVITMSLIVAAVSRILCIELFVMVWYRRNISIWNNYIRVNSFVILLHIHIFIIKLFSHPPHQYQNPMVANTIYWSFYTPLDLWQVHIQDGTQFRCDLNQQFQCNSCRSGQWSP